VMFCRKRKPLQHGRADIRMFPRRPLDALGIVKKRINPAGVKLMDGLEDGLRTRKCDKPFVDNRRIHRVAMSIPWGEEERV
jgi:hypothetical protein